MDNTGVEVLSCGKNEVNKERESVVLYLHGNPIARRRLDLGTLEITTAGWNTTTTKERLNGIPGVRVHTKAYQLFLNDKPWDGNWIAI